MPTSPARASKSGPSNAAPAAETTAAAIRARPVAPGTQRPDERADQADVPEVTSASVVAGIRETLESPAIVDAPQAVEVGGEILPEAFRPVPDEATPVAPQNEIRAERIEPAGFGRGRGVLGTRGGGGRGLGPSGPEQRSPFEGRVRKNRGGSRTRRGPKRTAFQRRMTAARPVGRHPLLNPWDLFPVDVRSSYAGQERAIFRTRGFLVSHWDFQMYRMLNTHNVSLVPHVFPIAPLWWPADWGHLPITLPWEVSLNRSLLVSADHDEAVWHEVYQKFLEQLAGGWDLLYSQVDNPADLEALPAELARAIVDVGGFSFCAGSVSSASYKKFLQLHSLSEESVPDQRTAKNTAWKRINTLKKERKATQHREPVATRAVCDCTDKLSRAVRRLGVEAQILDAVRDEAPPDVISDVGKLAALTSAVLTFALNMEQLVTRAGNMMRREERTMYGRRSEEALNLLEGSTALSDFLPARYASNLERLESRRS